MTDREIIEKILETEGGFVDHPADKGGPTNFGITIGTLSDWLHKPATPKDIAALSRETAVEIYLAKYVDGPGFDSLAGSSLRSVSRLKYLLVDMWVHHGPKRATLIIQKALNLPGDGIMGPKTMAKMRQGDTDIVFAKVLAERIRFFGRLIRNDPTQSVFAAGWFDRCADFIAEN